MRRRGFTLLEVVVVAGIMAFAIGPLLYMSRSSIRRTEHDMKRILAVNLSARMTERFAALPYGQLADLLGGGGFQPEQDPLLSPPTLPESLRESLGEYEKELRFEEVVPGRLGVLTVEVRWASKRDGPKNASLESARVVMNPY